MSEGRAAGLRGAGQECTHVALKARLGAHMHSCDLVTALSHRLTALGSLRTNSGLLMVPIDWLSLLITAVFF